MKHVQIEEALEKAKNDMYKIVTNISTIISELKEEKVKSTGLTQLMENIVVRESDNKEDRDLRRHDQSLSDSENSTLGNSIFAFEDHENEILETENYIEGVVVYENVIEGTKEKLWTSDKSLAAYQNNTLDDSIGGFEDNEKIKLETVKEETFKYEKEEPIELCSNETKGIKMKESIRKEGTLKMCNKMETGEISPLFEEIIDEEKIFSCGENAVENEGEETIKRKKEIKESKIITGREFQNEVERIAKNHNYLVKKADAFMTSYEKENVVIICIFKTGAITVKVNGILIGPQFKNCTAKNLNNIFKTPSKKTLQHENQQILKQEDKQSDSIENIDLIKGKHLQLKLERAAKNRGFFILQSEPSIVILKKDSVTVTWFSNGTVRIQVNGITRDPYISCSGHQFINILNNPKISQLDNPKEPIKTVEIDQSNASKDMKVEVKVPRPDVLHNENTKNPSKILPEGQQLNGTVNKLKKPDSSTVRAPLKSYAARHFEEQHFAGHHYPGKPVNSKVSKEEIKAKGLRILRESCKPGALPKGARAGQTLVMTKEEVNFENTGVRRYGQTGKARFVMDADHNPEDNVVVPVHLGGQAWLREDNRVEHGGVIYSQCFSQATQHLP